MSKIAIVKGATSYTVNVFIQDSSSTTGAGLTGLVFNTAGLTCYYVLPKAASVAVTLATLAAATSAWSSGGFKEIDSTNCPGLYRLDLPNAALAAGNDWVTVYLRGATNMAPCVLEIQLTAVDLNDGVRGAMTALPNAAANGVGGLGVLDANSLLDVDAKRLGGTTQTGRDIGASVLLSAGTGTGQLDFTSGVVKANLAQILGTALTETAGQLAAAFKQWFNVATPTGTVNSIPNAAPGASGGLPTTDANNAVKLQSGTAANQISLAAGLVTVGTNNDKTGYGLSAAAVQAVWDAATSALTTVGSIGKLLVDNINATISSRMATFSLPANFSLLSIDASGRVDVGKWLGATVNALIGGRVDANAGVVGDKTGYSLSTADITATLVSQGLVPWGSAVNDGAPTASAFVTQLTAADDDFFRGYLLQFVTGALAGQYRQIKSYNHTTKAVTVYTPFTRAPANTDQFKLTLAATAAASVLATPTQPVATDGSGEVTVGTNNDKTGYALSSGEHTNIGNDVWNRSIGIPVGGSYGAMAGDSSGRVVLTPAEHTAIAADAQTGLTAQGYTTTRAGFLDTLNGLVQAVWDKATSALTTAGSIGKLLVDNINATIGSRNSGNVTVGGYAAGQDPATLMLDAASGIEPSVTLRQALRVIFDAAGGTTDGAGTTTFHVKSRDGAKIRVTATVDANGNRSAITLGDLS